MNRKVFWNGVFIDEKDAKISIYSEYAMMGSSIFEMTRSFNGQQFKLKEHLQRLYDGAKIYRIEIPYTINELYDLCLETIEKNKSEFRDDDEHRLLISVSRACLSIYQEAENYNSGIDIFIADFPLRWTTKGMGKIFDEGYNAWITNQRTIPARYLDPKIKSRNRIQFLMANIEVSNIQGKNNIALMLDEDGHISEGPGDNFAIIKGNKIITPEGRNILRGISMQYIKELCQSYNFPQLEFIEKNIEPYDVYNADGAFVTASPFCLLPVVSLNGIKIGNGYPDSVYNFLLERWNQRVKVDIKKQIQDWDKEFGETIEGSTPYQFKGK